MSPVPDVSLMTRIVSRHLANFKREAKHAKRDRQSAIEACRHACVDGVAPPTSPEAAEGDGDLQPPP
jgi:hypothetical protein